MYIENNIACDYIDITNSRFTEEGGKMTKKQWNVNVADKLHIVEVEGGTWSFTGKLKVDDHTVKVWRQWLLLPKEVEFEVEGVKAFLKRKGMFASNFDMYVGGMKY
jgi:hypothetical protein